MRATRSAAVLGAALLISYAYFYQAGGWNQNSRFALVRAVIERHTVQIDAYAAHTGDRAVWQGHYYSDKAPGASFLALAPVAAARLVSRLAGVDPETVPGIAWTSYVASVATSGLFTALAALCVFWLAQRWGATTRAGIFAATAYGLAGPAWCYATLFVGHGVTAGCLMVAFAAAVELGETDVHRRGMAWLVGISCGLAVLSEFPAVVPVLLISALAVLSASDRDRGDLLPVTMRVVAGGAVFAAVLAAYHTAAFGSPLHLGYGNEDNAEGIAMQQEGLFGITYPTLHVTYEVLLGKYRGLLPLSPLVVFAPLGWVILARTPGRRRAVIVAVLTSAFYVLLNLSYKYWEGGWFYGPRHLTPALPFLALGLPPLWDRWRGTMRVVLVACWVWGTALTLIAVSTTPQPPSTVESPVTELMWPAFREGDLALNNQSFVDYTGNRDRLRRHPDLHVSWNLGELMKLHGLVSLLPLAVVWLIAAFLLL
jgi:hypothetical protein